MRFSTTRRHIGGCDLKIARKKTRRDWLVRVETESALVTSTKQHKLASN